MFTGLVVGGAVLPFAYAFFKCVWGYNPDRALWFASWTAAMVAFVIGFLIAGAGR